MTTDPRAGCGPLHHEDPARYDGPDPGDVVPGTEYEPGGIYDPAPDLVQLRKPGAYHIPDPMQHDPRVCGDHYAASDDADPAACLCTCNSCGAARGEPFFGPLCLAAYFGGCAHVVCGWIAANHVCPIEAFLADPITLAYGLGGDWDEWRHLVRCYLCEGQGLA
jgi:hypothetical protein